MLRDACKDSETHHRAVCVYSRGVCVVTKAGEGFVFVTTAVHSRSVFITHAEGLYRRLAY